MHISRIDEKLASLKLPVLQPSTRFELQRNDCLIVCAGFEERASAVLRSAISASTEFSVLIISYLPFIAENRLDEIRNLCHTAGVNASEAVYDRQDPGGFGNAMLESHNTTRGRIILDVSAMSRLLIVQSLVVLAGRDSGLSDCIIAYAEADVYPPSKEIVEHDLKMADEDPMYTILLLSSGIFEVTVVPELSSTSITSGQTRLVAFPTFSTDQLTALLNELGPSRLSIVHGIPPGAHNKWRTDAIAKINRLGNIPHEEFRTSTIDYRETLNTLLHLYAQYSERERLLVSPTGSKMQSVAVGLFRSFIKDVQIVYPTPIEFRSPSNYTKGVKQLYTLSLDSITLPCK